ncbi:MAG: outer membrane protein assembly factor BamB [Halofilum sp. (in: g-proteobacteria)]|nr:outer membrane protein assembly factor BamB [Halofilum sp. (in: g-proteobacteria)]
MMSVLRSPLAVLAVILGLAGCGTPEDTAVPPAELPDFDPAARITTVWKQSVGSAFNRKWVRMAPAVRENRVYAANVNGTVNAFDRDSGERIWRTQLERWLSAGVGVDGNHVYVGTVEGEVVALDRETGAEQWRHAAGGELLAPPVSGQGLVIVRSVDGRMLALSATDGSVEWVHSSDVPSLSLRGNSTPLLVPGGVIVGLDNGRLLALSANGGGGIWETEIAPPEGRSPIERMVDIDGNVGIGRSVVYAATYQGRIAQIDPQQGSIRWSRALSSYAGLNADGVRVYVSNADSHVLGLSPDNGSTQWRQEKLHHRRLTAPVPVSNSPWLILGDFDGFLHVLARADGRVVARTGLGGFGILADPVPVGDDRVLVQTQGGDLYMLRIGELD